MIDKSEIFQEDEKNLREIVDMIIRKSSDKEGGLEKLQVILEHKFAKM